MVMLLSLAGSLGTAQEDAARIYDAAEVAFRAGDFNAAKMRFVQAWNHVPSATTGIMIARCCIRLARLGGAGQLVEGQQWLARAMSLSTVTPAERAEGQATAAELRAAMIAAPRSTPYDARTSTASGVGAFVGLAVVGGLAWWFWGR